jgi:hypothetical protein
MKHNYIPLVSWVLAVALAFDLAMPNAAKAFTYALAKILFTKVNDLA